MAYTKNIRERFWKKVDVRGPSDCWEWQGAPGNHGYGTIIAGRGGRLGSYLAHRLSWEIHFGSIPLGMCVLHHCDNRICVNPDHLFLGTKSDNHRDMCRKGRNKTNGWENKTHCLRGHKFNFANTYLNPNHAGGRTCKTCRRAHLRRYQKEGRYRKSTNAIVLE